MASTTVRSAARSRIAVSKARAGIVHGHRVPQTSAAAASPCPPSESHRPPPSHAPPLPPPAQLSPSCRPPSGHRHRSSRASGTRARISAFQHTSRLGAQIVAKKSPPPDGCAPLSLTDTEAEPRQFPKRSSRSRFAPRSGSTWPLSRTSVMASSAMRCPTPGSPASRTTSREVDRDPPVAPCAIQEKPLVPESCAPIHPAALG